MRRFLLLVLLLFSIQACREIRVAKILKNFQNSEIAIPEDIIRIDKGITDVNPLFGQRGKLIVYVDSSSCSLCQIAHLEMFDNLFALADSTGLFDLIIMFSPTADNATDVLSMICKKKYKYPVYFDAAGKFASLNQQVIPIQKEYHTFLVDKEGFPIFVGNPNQSGKIYEVFIKSLSLL